MPTLVAICPYCRVGGVRAPATAVGASVTCPKCGSNFTVMPSDGLPGWSAGTTRAASPALEVKSVTVPTSASSSSTALPETTEPSPVVVRDDRPGRKSKSGPAPLVSPVGDSVGAAEPADPGQVLGLLGLILVGVAVVTSQLPFGRIIALVVAGVGFLAGLASLGAEGRAKLYGGLAIGLHALILIGVLFLPAWFNLDPWRNPVSDTPQGPVAIEHGSGTARPISANDWLDSSQSSWEFQDVRVTVRSATVAPIELIGPKGAKRLTNEAYLQLIVRVANIGVERPVMLTGWATNQADDLTITAVTGQVLKPVRFENGWAPEPVLPMERIFPGHAAEMRFVFAAPPAKADSLRLILPGQAVGLPQEQIRFQIGPFAGRVGTP